MKLGRPNHIKNFINQDREFRMDSKHNGGALESLNQERNRI